MVRRLLPVLCLIALHANAHAILKSSAPRAKEVIAGPDVTITLTFNSRIDVKRSQIAVVGKGNSERKLSLGNQPSADVVSTVAKGLQNGHYVVRWQVLANDGHISRGEIPFEVR
jgi:methionine-rich copper-binding protein CopC